MAITGKSTEFFITQRLRKQYGLKVDIQRLPDKYDTGKFEDTRPADFIIGMDRDLAKHCDMSNMFYIEAKETASMRTSINLKSTFQKGQIQGMRRAHALKIPYFVVIRFISVEKTYLVPATEFLDAIDAGKKSVPLATLEKYPWNNGALHDYHL